MSGNDGCQHSAENRCRKALQAVGRLLQPGSDVGGKQQKGQTDQQGSVGELLGQCMVYGQLACIAREDAREVAKPYGTEVFQDRPAGKVALCQERKEEDECGGK